MDDTNSPVPLTCINSGESATVVSVSGGHGRHARLAAMGVAAGVEVRVVHNAFHGPVILQVRGARIALGRGLASGIQVSPAQQPPADTQ